MIKTCLLPPFHIHSMWFFPIFFNPPKRQCEGNAWLANNSELPMDRLTRQYPTKNGQTDQNGEQATHVDIKQAKPTCIQLVICSYLVACQRHVRYCIVIYCYGWLPHVAPFHETLSKRCSHLFLPEFSTHQKGIAMGMPDWPKFRTDHEQTMADWPDNGQTVWKALKAPHVDIKQNQLVIHLLLFVYGLLDSQPRITHVFAIIT